MKYALLFDLGNTNIKIGLADKKGLLQSFSLPSGNTHTADSLGLKLLQLLSYAGMEPKDLEMALACSVVPGLNPVLRLACARFCNLELRLVPEDIPVGLENRYAQPTQVGADRLVGAYAARLLYPEPASLICVDYGTATTFDCVEGNAYLGGLICPGVLSAADALASRTAKLPAVSLETDDLSPQPGTSTSTSINHGFLFGFAAFDGKPDRHAGGDHPKEHKNNRSVRRGTTGHCHEKPPRRKLDENRSLLSASEILAGTFCRISPLVVGGSRGRGELFILLRWFFWEPG